MAGAAVLLVVSVAHFVRESGGTVSAIDRIALLGVILGFGIPFVTLQTLGVAPADPPNTNFKDALLVTASRERALLYLAPLWYVIPILGPTYFYAASALPLPATGVGPWLLPLAFAMAAVAVTALNFRAALHLGRLLRSINGSHAA